MYRNENLSKERRIISQNSLQCQLVPLGYVSCYSPQLINVIHHLCGDKVETNVSSTRLGISSSPIIILNDCSAGGLWIPGTPTC